MLQLTSEMLGHRRRYFVLNDTASTLAYFTSEKCTIQKGFIGLVEIQHVCCTGTSLEITTPTRTFYLEGESEAVCVKFAAALNHRRNSMPTMKRRSDWTADHESNACVICRRKFTVTFRRHHCRLCGDLLCGDCAPIRKSVALKKKGGVRCCHECFAELASDSSGGSSPKHINP